MAMRGFGLAEAVAGAGPTRLIRNTDDALLTLTSAALPRADADPDRVLVYAGCVRIGKRDLGIALLCRAPMEAWDRTISDAFIATLLELNRAGE